MVAVVAENGVIYDVYIDVFCFFKQKTAYEMRISDWSSDVCSSDLVMNAPRVAPGLEELGELLLLAPFHRWLGLRIAEVGTDELVISMPWRDEIISNPTVDRQSVVSGKSVSVRVDLGGRRHIKKQKKTNTTHTSNNIYQKLSEITNYHK